MRQGQAPRVAAASDDADLVRRAQERDGSAFRTIMQRHNRRLYRLARSILRNDREAEDVVQEAYVRAFTHMETFRGDSSLATWLARITMNEALGRLRRQRPTMDWTTLENSSNGSSDHSVSSIKNIRGSGTDTGATRNSSSC